MLMVFQFSQNFLFVNFSPYQVASGGYGSDQVEAINILSAVRSGGNLAVAVLLKPFSFEGRRRLEEVVLCCL